MMLCIGACRCGMRRVRLHFFKAFTFVEAIITILLLVVFTSIAYPLVFGTTKATLVQSKATVALESRLTLVTLLRADALHIRVPYWSGQDGLFQHDGNSWSASYWDGHEDQKWTISISDDGRWTISTPASTMLLTNLRGESLDWWKQNSRIIGLVATFGTESHTQTVHFAWGSLPW